jgi:hypothetical protein
MSAKAVKGDVLRDSPNPAYWEDNDKTKNL